MNEVSTLLEELKHSEKYRNYYHHCDVLPKPFCNGPSSAKAIVLGTDPTNLGTDPDKPQLKELEFVFGLENPRSPYFSIIRTNLKKLGLSPEGVFVQNLCRNYFTEVTQKNQVWEDVARLWIPVLKRELDGLFPPAMPVLLTARVLYDVLVSDDARRKTPTLRLYEEAIFIKPEENELRRPLVPFFRHARYRLSQWPKYVEKFKRVFPD